MIRKISIFILFTAFSFSVKGQYRELIYYHFPLGEVKFFHQNQEVLFKLKSDEKFVDRKGPINLVTDTMFEMNNVRFKPSNLQWISSPPTRQFRVMKNVAGSLVLAGGLATVAYGFMYFPKDRLKTEDEGKYHKKNKEAIDYSLAGIAMAAISIPIYQLHPKRYSSVRKWRAKYQR